MATGSISSAVIARLRRRDASDPDDTEDPDTGQKEIFSSYALLILILLLIVAFFTSYILRSKKIQAVHETVISIFAGMAVGLILRLTVVTSVLDAVSFDYQFFFNLLLPPIILASGYELHQVGHVDITNPASLLTELQRPTSSATLERSSLSHLLEPSYLHWSWV
jgi:sodium/hydrogen exchanger-like protein 6/7